jgi:hypothetical protein
LENSSKIVSILSLGAERLEPPEGSGAAAGGLLVLAGLLLGGAIRALTRR